MVIVQELTATARSVETSPREHRFMEIFNAEFFVLTLALVGVVIIIAALLSGLIDSSDLPQVGAFLALGAMLGPAGLGLLDVSLNSAMAHQRLDEGGRLRLEFEQPVLAVGIAGLGRGLGRLVNARDH